MGLCYDWLDALIDIASGIALIADLVLAGPTGEGIVVATALQGLKQGGKQAIKIGVKRSKQARKTGVRSKRQRLEPDPNAQGPHSVFRRDSNTGKITHYETYTPQTNPKNPNPWEKVKRYDGVGSSHYNKATKQNVSTPHVHDPKAPGGVRPAKPNEIPK